MELMRNGDPCPDVWVNHIKRIFAAIDLQDALNHNVGSKTVRSILKTALWRWILTCIKAYKRLNRWSSNLTLTTSIERIIFSFSNMAISFGWGERRGTFVLLYKLETTDSLLKRSKTYPLWDKTPGSLAAIFLSIQMLSQSSFQPSTRKLWRHENTQARGLHDPYPFAVMHMWQYLQKSWGSGLSQ